MRKGPRLQPPPELIVNRDLEEPMGTGAKRRTLSGVVAALVALSCLMAPALACGSTSPSPDTPETPPVKTAILSPGTPWPESTPKPATGLRMVELDPAYLPVYAHGREYAAIGPDDQLYIINVETGETDKATDGEHPKYHAAFSADYVAWTDRRREIELPDVDSDPRFNHSDDIFVLHRATGQTKRITQAPASELLSKSPATGWSGWTGGTRLDNTTPTSTYTPTT